MGGSNTNAQLYWAAGAILGGLVVCLFGLSIGEKGLHEWQELIAGAIGSTFTLIGAGLIVEQIKADDQREEKTARRKTLEIAQATIIEVKRILNVLAEKEVDATNIAQISKSMISDGHGGYDFATKIDRLDYDLLVERSETVPDHSRLSTHVHSAGALGLITGEIVVRFYEEVRTLKPLALPPVAQKTLPENFWIYMAGQTGEAALRLLTILIDNSGDFSAVPELDFSDSLKIDGAAWRERVNNAWTTWHMVRGLRDYPRPSSDQTSF